MRHPSAHHDVGGFASSSPVISCPKYALELSRVKVGEEFSNRVRGVLDVSVWTSVRMSWTQRESSTMLLDASLGRGASRVVRIRDRDVLRHLIKFGRAVQRLERLNRPLIAFGRICYSLIQNPPLHLVVLYPELPPRSAIYA